MRLGRQTSDGITLVETTVAILLLSVGVVSLSGVLVSVEQQYRQASTRYAVLEQATSVLEEIKGSRPESVHREHHGTTFDVPGVSGATPGQTVIRVSVDPTNPRLVGVTVQAEWDVLGHTETLELQTEIYSAREQE